MRTYTLLALVLSSATPPGAGAPVLMTAATRARALNTASRLPERVSAGSSTLGGVQVTTKVVMDNVPDTSYFTLGSGDWYPSGQQIATQTADWNQYDFVLVFCSTAQTTNPVWSGYTLVTTAFASASTNLCEGIAFHELGHLIGYHMEVTGLYTNWPVCADNNGPSKGIHCGNEYGYASDIAYDFLDDYYSGQVAGTGMDTTAWAVTTPTERGDRDPIDLARLSDSPWGSLGPIIIGA